MRLLLDQGVPRTAASILRTAGIDALHVAELGASRASDVAILAMARDEGRAVITFDADFHAILALSGAEAPSVIRVRLEGLRAATFADLMLRVCRQVEEDLAYGAVVTVTEVTIRVRRLPLIRE